MVLKAELGLIGPNSQAHKMARQIRKYGYTAPSDDWATRAYTSPQEFRTAFIQHGAVELSAISGVIIGGIGQHVNYHDLQVAVDVPGEEDPQIVTATSKALEQVTTATDKYSFF